MGSEKHLVGLRVEALVDVAQDHDAHDPYGDPELKLGQRQAPKLRLRLLGDDVVGGPHQAEEHPDHQGVYVKGAEGVKGKYEGLGPDKLNARRQPHQYLNPEEQSGGLKKMLGYALAFIFHGRCSSLLESQKIVRNLS